MTEFLMGVAGTNVRVRAMFDSTRQFCRAYPADGAPQVTLTMTAQMIARERGMLGAEAASDAYLETLALQRALAELLIGRDTLLMHGSAVAVDGKAYLFTARSGTGKSTHTRLWRELLGERARMVNDDKPFLRCTDEGVLACGAPWNGKHALGENVQLPLAAICLLERGTENTICRISPREALKTLLQQSFRPTAPEAAARYAGLIAQVAERVRFYRLQCDMSLQAARTSYGAMAREEEK